MGLIKRGIKTAVGIINILVLSLAGLLGFYSLSLPDTYFITASSEVGPLPEYISFRSDKDTIAPVMTGQSVSAGELILFGVFPVKDVTVFDMGTPMLIPSGEPFGIKMLTDGVVVTDVNGFNTESGYESPAKDAGIRPGDVIKLIDGKKIMGNADVSAIVSKGKPVNIVYERKNEERTVTVVPKKSDSGFKIGLWVKDSSAGIGTLTFYDAVEGRFAGLGHPVCDAGSGALMPLSSGEAVEVSVNGVIKGRAGYPGELTGLFKAQNEIGKLLVNSPSGVYGEVESDILYGSEAFIGGAVPLGTRAQIEVGEAYIYSTVDGFTPEMFKINIEKIASHSDNSDNGKDMVILVTDERLLKATGGIVQGMSGSPILQNGRLIGAVTHVFVNNPQKGYAIFADTMYSTSLTARSTSLSANAA